MTPILQRKQCRVRIYALNTPTPRYLFHMNRAKRMYEMYAVEIYSQSSHICLFGRMDMALIKSRSS